LWDIFVAEQHNHLPGADPGILERAKPRTERRRRERWRRGVWRASPENFEKSDAISCNLAYIFGIRMALNSIQNWAFAEQKTGVATISIHTHTCTPTLPKTPRISATIKSKFNFKNTFSVASVLLTDLQYIAPVLCAVCRSPAHQTSEH